MTETITEDQTASSPLTPISAARLLQVFILGAVVGLTVWALTLFLERYVFQAILCQGTQAMQCVPGMQYAEASAGILGAGAGLYFLVKLQVFRPLLVSLAALISLWGIIHLTQTLPWYGVGLSVVGLYALAYTAYAWVARMRAFWLVAILLLVFVVAIRLILSS